MPFSIPRNAAAPATQASPAAAAQPAASPAAAGASAAATLAPATDKVQVALGNNSTPDQSYLPTYMALDAMKKAGYNVIDPITFKSDTLNVQALASNQVQFVTGALPVFATSINQGLPLKIIATRANNAWSLVAQNDITKCDQLDGKNVGIFSEGGVSTAFLKIYLQQNCPNAKPNYLIIADSPLRRQALESGQLVATPLEPGDTSDIIAKSSDKFHVLANFGQTMPDIGRDIIATNTTMLKDHPAVVQAFVQAEVQAIRQLYQDPASVEKLDAQYLKLGDGAPLVAKFFMDNKEFCANGGLDDANIAHTLDVFGNQYTFVPKGMTVDQIVDKGPMTAALGVLGKSSATSC